MKRVTTQFKALQRYMNSAARLNHSVFETTVGYKYKEHGANYARSQVANNVGDLGDTRVKPFTLFYFFKHFLGESVAASFKNRVLSEFGNGKYLKLQEAIENNTITSAQIEALKDEIEDQVLALLGPFRILLVEIPILSDLEDAVADIILGDHIEEIRDSIANVSIPQPFSDLLCEN